MALVRRYSQVLAVGSRAWTWRRMPPAVRPRGIPPGVVEAAGRFGSATSFGGDCTQLNQGVRIELWVSKVRIEIAEAQLSATGHRREFGSAERSRVMAARWVIRGVRRGGSRTPVAQQMFVGHGFRRRPGQKAPTIISNLVGLPPVDPTKSTAQQ
jgi:hypothetical protein